MRWIGWILLTGICAGRAGAQDWSRLGRLKPGTLIQVHSLGDPYGLDDRCRLEAVDPSLLRCLWEGDGATRMLYPADRVATVYEVHRPAPPAAGWVALGFVALIVAGLATQNAGVILFGICGSLFTLGFSHLPSWNAMGAPPPPERLRLVYRR